MMKWVDAIIEGVECEVETEMTLEEALECAVDYGMTLDELNVHLDENGHKKVFLDEWATEDYNCGESINVDYDCYTLEFDDCGELIAYYER